ncbi:ornithine cyclodeaminase family protein [Mesorhizobium sp. BR1-1-16]|uniref:ornithine cyclodeaminase family protein n=1 Tax=Mesorhizobium sp. BR1-1-16 TaxID=2876653 RepID=UPI001CC92288|nr:ornithine cyclodeaminase family protein [Mesorhizobium sp. BR1-1-16]MBZ9938109.1 ornithine cyclodeaminase family protein [Mesorhizobium sp. BR1-1-16]
MRLIDGAALDAALSRHELVETLREAFRSEITVPPREHHSIARSGGDASLLLMPAWSGAAEAASDHVGVKIVTVFPGNAANGLATVAGVYLLLSGETGAPLAVIDGTALTLWRTAAASALAASYLARADAAHLLMIGAGALAPHLVAAHAAMRPITRVTLWNRDVSRAERLAERLAGDGLDVEVETDLARALPQADIISCATLSSEPLVRGALVKPGAHLDLVGGFTPAMREADDTAIRRARVYVDGPGAIAEAGDIAAPLAGGVLAPDEIVGDLQGLCRGLIDGRRTADEITLFKSVGIALEDLAAGALIWRKLGS